MQDLGGTDPTQETRARSPGFHRATSISRTHQTDQASIFIFPPRQGLRGVERRIKRGASEGRYPHRSMRLLHNNTNPPYKSNTYCRRPTPTGLHQQLLAYTNNYCRTPTPTDAHQHLLPYTNTYYGTPTPTGVHHYLLTYTNTSCRTTTPTDVHQQLLPYTNTYCRTPTPIYCRTPTSIAVHERLLLPDTNT